MSQENIKRVEYELKVKENECRRLYQKLTNIRQSNHCIKITDHAVVRYLERVQKLEMETVVHQELLTEPVRKMYAQLGDGTYPTGKGTTRVVIKEGTIVTVIN